MIGVSLERHGEALVAAKRSESSRRLAAEADMLKRLHHPGVVEFISFNEGDQPLLITAWAGTDTWERRSSSDMNTALGLLAAVAATVADLHVAGIAHRSLSPQHIIIANDGRPVLCGFGDAGQADEAGMEADKKGLGDLVRFASESVGGQDAERLASLSGWLEEPHSDPAGFARVVDAMVSEEISPPKPQSALKTGLIVGLIAAVVISVGIVATSRHDQITVQSPIPISPGSISAPATTSAPPATFAPLTTSVAPPGTDEPLSAPLILQHGGRLYGLGTGGDLTVVGDWNCDGQATPAMLQVATGVVAVFSAWPAPGAQLEPQFTVPAPGIESLQAEASGDCDVLRARSAYGSRIITQESS